MVALSFQCARSQEIAVKKEVLFENQNTLEKIRIGTGSKVAIWFKIPKVRIVGTILFLSDSTLIISTSTQKQFVSFRNIDNVDVIQKVREKWIVRKKQPVRTRKPPKGFKRQFILKTGDEVALKSKTPNARITGIIVYLSDSSMIIKVKHEEKFLSFGNILSIRVLNRKRYDVKLTLKSGKVLHGKLFHTSRDSVSILTNRNLQLVSIGTSEILLIKVRASTALVLGSVIGSSIGGTLGAIIGAASYSVPDDCGADCGGILDLAPMVLIGLMGFAIGGATGSAVGAMIGSRSKEFKFEGDQNQFDLFVNKYKNEVSKWNQNRNRADSLESFR